MIKHLLFLILATLFIGGTIFATQMVSFITDWWWFSNLGYSQVFVKTLSSKAIIGVSVIILSTVFLLVNLLIALSSKIPWLITLPAGFIGDQPVTLDNKLIRKTTLYLSFILAVILGVVAAFGWEDVLKFFSATAFGVDDPVFGHDISFYIFSLPFWNKLLWLVRTLVLFTTIICGGVYLLRGRINLSQLQTLIFRKSHLRDKNQETATSRIHISFLLFFFLTIIAASKYLSLFKLVISQSGSQFGAYYTDVTIMIPIIYISIFILAAASLLSLFWGLTGKIFPLAAAIFLYAFMGVFSQIFPPLYQKLFVAPNELVKETPFIKYNIASTRKAFGVDDIKELDILGDKAITSADIAANDLTIKNIRLWDRAPLLSTFSQIQEIRTYYEFVSVDNDRYTIDGKLRQIMLSPRELASESLSNRSWINERLTFTHGYGVAAGAVNQATVEGLPVLFVKDLPPQSEVSELAISQPEIYFGEIESDYVIVNSQAKEFDYPKGEENVYTSYEGKDGIVINSIFKRLFFALRFGSLKLLLSNDISNESKIIYYRRIKDRVAKIAPFLTFDRDPYLVIADGRLYWIIDAYTSSRNYPYSAPLHLDGRAVNYIRNSVKVVVDAYHGSVKFYFSDPDDPIIKTYGKIFPGVFDSITNMPKSLTAHLRYPEDIFTLQTAIYTIYHMQDPQIFYNKEDQWEIPTISESSEARGEESRLATMTPRHIIMRLPKEEKEEFILMLPFTPRGKDNLSAWMVARNDGENYGKLLVYRTPKQKLIFGPKQVIGRINQDAEISGQITLWDQRGSQVIQGPLLVIPIEESLIYVRPLYLKAEDGKIPELKRVIVVYGNSIAMEETLEEALTKLFGGGARLEERRGNEEKVVGDRVTERNELIKQANEIYEAAISAQKEGNWARYGNEIQKLGEALKKLK